MIREYQYESSILDDFSYYEKKQEELVEYKHYMGNMGGNQQQSFNPNQQQMPKKMIIQNHNNSQFGNNQIGQGNMGNYGGVQLQGEMQGNMMREMPSNQNFKGNYGNINMNIQQGGIKERIQNQERMQEGKKEIIQDRGQDFERMQGGGRGGYMGGGANMGCMGRGNIQYNNEGGNFGNSYGNQGFEMSSTEETDDIYNNNMPKKNFPSKGQMK